MTDKYPSHLTMRLPKEELDALKTHCRSQDLRVSQLVRRLVREFLKQQKEGNNG